MRALFFILLMIVPSVSMAGPGTVLFGGSGTSTEGVPSEGGGAGTGTETRYFELTADSHVVARCSEPLDGPNGEVLDFDTVGTYDSTLSPDSYECWDRGTNDDPWQRDHYQTGHSQTIASVTGWGTVSNASEQTTGAGDFWPAYRPSRVSALGVTEATYCLRYYKQVTSDYAITSDSCGGGGGTNRNKLSEINIANHPFQTEEDPTPGGGCHTVSESSVTRGIMACWDSGPGQEADESCPWLSPTVKLSSGVSHPLRIELCYETTDFATGANGVVKAYVTPYPYTTRSQYVSPSATLGAPTKDGNWMNNLDHTGGGTSWSGYHMFVLWDNIGSHTIGAACEIEGGC